MCAPIFDPMPATGHLRAAPLAAHSHNLATQSDAPVHPNGGEVLARLDRSDELERMNDGGVPFSDLVGDTPARPFRRTDGHK